MELTITQHSDEAGHRTLALAGSIDLTTRQSLVEAGTAVLTEVALLTLDMADVEFIDSTGIGSLLELGRIATANGARMEISRRSPRVARVLEVTGLDSTWPAASAQAGSASSDR